MATAVTSDFQSIQTELGRAIRRRREDCPPTETARLLLSYDGPGQPLVGIRYDAARAVYVDERGRQAIAVAFGAEGVDARRGRPIATFGDQGCTLEGWVEKMRSYWGWRHPRYR